MKQSIASVVGYTSLLTAFPVEMAVEQTQIFEDEFPLVRSCAALNEIRLAEEIKDITIKVQNGALLHAHRIILAARIPALRTSLSTQRSGDNSVIRWPTVSLSIAETLINYAYTGQVEITQSNVRGIIMVAKMMNLPVLESWGTKFLANGLTLQTLAVAWDFARSLNIASLTDVCLNLMHEQFQSFAQTELFVRLPADLLLNLLRRDDLPVDSEEEVFAAVSRWVCPWEEVDQQRLDLHALSLLREVRWGQTTVQFRKHLVNNHQIFKNVNECVRFMLQVEQWITYPEEDKKLCPFNPWSRPPQSLLIFGKDKGKDAWSVFCFDSDLQMRERVADMERRELATYSVVGESVFVIGGRTSQENHTSDVKEFLVREHRWRDRASLAVKRNSHAATTVKVGDEKTLIGIFGGFGGEYLSACEIYDVNRDIRCKFPDLREKRGECPAAVCLPSDGRIFVFGGYTGSSRLASVEFCRLDADWEQRATAARTADFWQVAAPMRTARQSLAATHFRGKIIVAGGYGDRRTLSVVELFTPPDTSSPLGQWTALANMQQPRHYFALLASANAVFALGSTNTPCNTVEELTPPAGSASSDNDLKSWAWSSRSPVETLDRIWGAASIEL